MRVQSRDHHAFEKLVRVLVQDVAVFEGAGLGFVTVDHKVVRLSVLALDEAPFHADRKTGPAAAAQVGSFYFSHNLLGLHLERFLQGLIPPVAEITVERSVIVLTRDIF